MELSALARRNVDPNDIAQQFVDGLEQWDPFLSSEMIFNYLVSITKNRKISFTSELKNGIENLSIKNLSKIFKNIPKKLQLKSYNEIIIKICKLSYEKNLLLPTNINENNWLIICKKLFNLLINQRELKFENTALNCDDIHNLGSKLSLPFAISLSEIFTTIPSENYKNQQIMGQKICQEFLGYVEKAVFSPIIGITITDNICNIHEKTLEFFITNGDRQEFYLLNIANQNTEICNRILKSIFNILNKNKEIDVLANEYQHLKYFEKFIIVNSERIFSQFLYITTNNKTFHLFIDIFNYLSENLNWYCTDNQFILLFYKIFDKSKVQNLYAKYYIDIMRNIDCNETDIDGKILRSLLNNYFKYKIKNKNINTLIDQIFDHFDYIHNYENLFKLYGAIEDIAANVIISQIIAGVTIKLVASEIPGKHEQILLLLKKLPILLVRNESYFVAYNHLLQIFDTIDLNIYREENLMNTKYYYRLLKTFKSIIGSTELKYNIYHDRLISNIFCILKKFNNLKLPTVTELVNEIKINLDYDIMANSDNINILQNYPLYEKFTKTIMILSNILNNNFEPIDDWKKIFDLIKKLLISGEIRKLSTQFNYSAESFCIQFLTNYLQKIYQIANISIELIKFCRENCMHMINYLIKPALNINWNILWPKNAISSMITILLILNTPNFKLILDVPYQHLIQKAHEFIFSNNNNWNELDSTIVEIKCDILNEIINFHKFILPSHEIWKILIEVGGDHEFTNELEKLTIVLLKNHGGEKFTIIYGQILFNISLKINYSTKNVIKVLRKLIRNVVPYNDDDETSLCYLSIEAATVLYLIDLIGIEINKRNITPGRTANMINILKEINPLLDYFRYTKNIDILKSTAEKLKSTASTNMTQAEKNNLSQFINNLKNLKETRFLKVP